METEIGKTVRIASEAAFDEPLETGVESGVGVIVVQDTNILLGKRAKKGKYGYGTWCFPGGSMEEGETALDAGIREMKEETNLTGKNLQHVASYTFQNMREHCFVTEDFSGKMKRKEDEFSELIWVDFSKLDSMDLFSPSKVCWEYFKEYITKMVVK